MGIMVIALFRPKPRMEETLMACMREHQPVLRSEGLVTDRPAYVMRAADGTLLEVFEWRSQAAIDAAHANPRVHELWARYAACCDYVTLGELVEAKAMFPGFEPVTL
jgi:quinol monooxygenase YgiN